MFEDMVPSVERLKNSFVYAFWSWSRNITDFLSLVVTDFFCVFWIQFRGWLLFSFPLFFVLDFWSFSILPVLLVHPFIFNIFLLFCLSKEKKKYVFVISPICSAVWFTVKLSITLS